MVGLGVGALGGGGFLFAVEEWMTSSDSVERKAPPPFPRTT